MTERLIVGNLDCETGFAAHSWSSVVPAILPRPVLENISAAATLLRVFCAEGDRLWTPIAVDADRLSGPPELARPALTGGPLPTENTGGVLAWGETESIAALRAGSPATPAYRQEAPLAETVWNLPATCAAAAAGVNDKRFCQRLREKLDLALPASRVLKSLRELEDHLENEKNNPELSGGWVLKAPFSAAGRLRLIAEGPGAGELELKRARNLFDAHGALVFEPWLERTSDFGFCTLVLEERTVLLGPHGLETDTQGRFRGLAFSPSPTGNLPGLETAAGAATDAAREEGYLGPLEIDCWSWRDSRGREHFHPLGEINARISFGLVGRAIIETLGEATGWSSQEPARLLIGPQQLRDDSAESIELLRPAEPDGCGAWLERSSSA